ncbi:hypothetical protein Mhun_2206 [Methanospirillum hungatei JF-1]|jgi:hypothetical protein|uniref:Uncharacterized protein n=1 Tax=Methanospirillum hungatei JF-1 (strain ATCC 27890 / DSM 864 / NBRC 100397 / JF-1) TaxID=323259 RepID=Q2FSH6_METHJ|nr:hypothetical protein Mhun_2206 [Methanospirillum hungatei JF-1]OQA60669.1 MAG: hypothetical protein BWY45_00031 [Euryarchaeota archaeon ADurb.Bin294]
MTQCIFIDGFCTQNRQYLPEPKNIRASYHLPIAYYGLPVKEISFMEILKRKVMPFMNEPSCNRYKFTHESGNYRYHEKIKENF